MLSHIWTRAAAGASAAALVTGLAAAPDAAAQTQPVAVGQCVSPAVLSAQLKAEGQKIVYTGLRYGIYTSSQGKEYSSKLGMNATSTPDGKKGYIVHECSDDFGKSDGRLKIAAATENVRVYSDDLKTAHPAMKVSHPLKLALDTCAKSKRGTCEPHNTIVDKIYKVGGFIPYQARIPATGMIITISVVDKGGMVHLTETTSGASTAYGGVLLDPRYSNFVLSNDKTIPVREDRLGEASRGPLLAAAPQ